MPKIVWCENRTSGHGPAPFFEEDLDNARRHGFEPCATQPATESASEPAAATPAEPAAAESTPANESESEHDAPHSDAVSE